MRREKDREGESKRRVREEAEKGRERVRERRRGGAKLWYTYKTLATY